MLTHRNTKFLAAFELATKAALGEKAKLEIVDEDLLDPLNVLTVSDDKYTQEHATEAVAELLTLPSIQVSGAERFDCG